MTATGKSVLNESDWLGKAFTGSWTATAGGEADVAEKATGSRLTTVGLANAEDVAVSAGAASKAQEKWIAMPYEARAAIFRKAARIIDENGKELVEWIIRETGAIAAKGDVELHMASGILNQSAAMLTEPQGIVLPSNGGRMSIARRVPHGVVGIISPFNFPLILSIRAVSPALATGNAVILKPDLRTPVSGGFLIARVFEEAGLPAGLLHVLPGGAEAGEALCRDPRIPMIAFTGSTANGRRVGALAGEHLKKVSLELGGKNSIIILDDADIDAAASNARWGAWLHQGQICMTAGRILVQEKVAGPLVERLVKVANSLPVGDPKTRKVVLGPIINEAQLQRVHGIVQDTVKAGAQLKAGGTHEGLFYRPTVLDGVKPGMRAFDEEIFGPVASVTTFTTDDEAVALSNQTEYGLSAAVISSSISRALALGNKLKTGLLHINDQTVADEPHVPFGGRGTSGNGTRIGGPANWEEFTQWQWLTIKDKATPYPF
ncbi:MAG TPA: benzaldehyde dehydrogenase [Bryobacteraceae bacterium]|jgi:benzaldehyde dehydrogenase (NAD)|nr:benzaldehyde dehydrogenase [Bryobacteraceae bacterium]